MNWYFLLKDFFRVFGKLKQRVFCQPISLALELILSPTFTSFIFNFLLCVSRGVSDHKDLIDGLLTAQVSDLVKEDLMGFIPHASLRIYARHESLELFHIACKG